LNFEGGPDKGSVTKNFNPENFRGITFDEYTGRSSITRPSVYARVYPFQNFQLYVSAFAGTMTGEHQEFRSINALAVDSRALQVYPITPNVMTGTVDLAPDHFCGINLGYRHGFSGGFFLGTQLSLSYETLNTHVYTQFYSAASDLSTDIPVLYGNSLAVRNNLFPRKNSFLPVLLVYFGTAI